jgi:hypothetical protein
MKISILFLALISFSTGIAQVADWYKTDLSTLGLKKNTINFSESCYFVPGQPVPQNIPVGPAIKFEGLSTELSADFFTKHAYFHIDGSLMTDLIIDYTMRAILKKQEKNPWYDKDFGHYDGVKFLPIRLGFGTNITKYFSIYGGGQWQYSLYRFTPYNNVHGGPRLGGNIYGVGIHGVFALGPVLIKQSYMYDWISRASHFKGNMITHETAFYFGYSNAGLFVKLNYQDRIMYGGELSSEISAILKSDLAVNTNDYPEFTNQHLTVSFGIYAAGLFSGISKSTGKIGEIEQGVRKERNDKKRRTIEYKD